MGNENQIKPLKVFNLPVNPGEAKKSGETRHAPQTELPKRENPKQNAPLLFDKKWQNAQAKDLKNNLTTMILGGEKKPVAANHHENAPRTTAFSGGEKTLPNAHNQPNKHQTEQAKNLNTRPAEQTREQTKNLNSHQTEQAKTLTEHQTEQGKTLTVRLTEQVKTLNTHQAEQTKTLSTHQAEQIKTLNTHQPEQVKTLTAYQPEQTKNLTKQPAEQTKNLNIYPTEQAKTLTSRLTEQTKNPDTHQPEQTKNPDTHLTKQAKTLNTYQPEQTRNLNRHQPEQAKNLLNQTWDGLVNNAKEHKDLAAFRDKPKQFWNDVRQMSEIRVVETYVNGKAEPRAVSRYGELFRQLERHGGRLETFLTTLPPGERKVFEARYQMNRTFGASNLFVGSGIALDKRGDFPVRVFLSLNGKNVELPPHAIISLLNGKTVEIAPRSIMNSPDGKIFNFSSPQTVSNAPDGDFFGGEIALLENASIFTNGEVLLNAKSAALLSLSLALYQNISVMLPLTDVAPEIVPQNQPGDLSPKTTNAPNEQIAGRTANRTTLENGKQNVNLSHRTNEANVAGALINGALTTIDKYRKSRYSAAGASAKTDSKNIGFGFSAGATGSMMGATVGCIVPLAEKSVGEILGFAASVVVGLTDNGLRSLGVNTLVSVITTGAQIFLSAASGSTRANQTNESAPKALNAAEAKSLFEDDLRQTIFNRRTTTLLAS